MKVIFLDIDGVMNSVYTRPVEHGKAVLIHEILVGRFNKILADTGAHWVLSSTWRKFDNWKEEMRNAGLNMDRLLGRTPDFNGERWAWQKENPDRPAIEFMERGKEIQSWIEDHGKEGMIFCILDDDSDMLPEQKHFKTSFLEGGLTESIAAEVTKYLNSHD